MSDNGFRIVVLNAVIVIALGMFLGGFPLLWTMVPDTYGQAVPIDPPADYRAWMMAHLEGILNGMLMIALAVITRFRPMGQMSEWLYVPALLVLGYGNTLAALAAAGWNVRGMAFDANLANNLVALGFTLALIGSLVALVVAVRHLLPRA